MKTIFTSNYARNGSNPNAYGISASVPKWYTGARLRWLAPSWDIIFAVQKGHISDEEYGDRYLKELTKKYTAEMVIAGIPDGAILLCYESPGDFCHRRVLAEWVEKETGIVIPEVKDKKTIEYERQLQFVESMLEF